MKKWLLLALLFPSISFAQNGGALVSGIVVLGSTGRPVAGATVTVCQLTDNGVPCTQTVNLYSDPLLTVPMANPTTTDGSGNVFAFAQPGAYHWTVTGQGVSSVGQPFSATVAGVGAGNVVSTGNNALTGNNTASNINNIIAVDGVKYTTLAAALADPVCLTGCTVDMRGNSSNTALNIGSIDPGSGHSVTVLLGPYVYHIATITVRTNFHLHGAGSGDDGIAHPTTLLADCSSCDGTSAIVMGGFVAQGVELDNFRLYAKPGNASQKGINMVAPPNGGGNWYSSYHDLCVGACGPGLVSFASGNIIFDGTAGGSPDGINQLNDFTRVLSFRSANKSYAFQAKGQAAQFTFNQVEFDGPGQTADSSPIPNLWLGDGVAGLTTPLTTFIFNELTCQQTAICASFNGAWDITFHQIHVEQASVAFQQTVGATNGNINIVSDKGYYAVNTGVNSGSGALINMVSGTNSFTLLNSYIISTPDAYCVGSGCTVGFSALNNLGPGGNTSNNNAALSRIPSSLQAVNYQSNLGTPMTSGNITLSAGFGTGSSITNFQFPYSTAQNAYFTINVGTSPSANPTVTVAFPNGFQTPVLCEMTQHGGTHPESLLTQTAPISTSQAIFTFVGTPTAGLGLTVSMRCGP